MRRRGHPHEEDDSVERIRASLPGDRILRRRRRRIVTLKRALGVPGVFSVAYGNLGSSIYYALGVTTVFALGATPLVFMIASIFFICTALTYAEGTAAMPEAGGSSSFARKGFNEMVSFIAAWCLVLGYIVTISISAYTAISYLGYFWEPFQTYPTNVIATAVVLLMLMLLNIRGVQESSSLNIFFALIDIATQAFLVILGLVFLFNIKTLTSQIYWGLAPTWKQFLLSFSMVMVCFTGIETASNMAEEAKGPEKTVPRAIGWTILVSLLMFFGLASIALSCMKVEYAARGYVYAIPGPISEGKRLVYYREIGQGTKGEPAEGVSVKVDGHPIGVFTDKDGRFTLEGIPAGRHTLEFNKPGYPEEEITFDNTDRVRDPVDGEWTTELVTKWLNDPVAGIAHHLPILRDIMTFWVAILAATILIIATNAGILGISRLCFSMGIYNHIPPALGKIHRRYRTPYIAIIIFTIIGILIVIPADLTRLADAYIFGAMLSYTIAHVSLIALRVKHPEMNRPFKLPLNLKIRGREIPFTAILGGLGTMTVWIMVTLTQPYGRAIGLPFIAIGVIMYMLYRRFIGLSLTETKMTRPKR